MTRAQAVREDGWSAAARWLLGHRRLQEPSAPIVTVGSGPLAEEAFDAVLKEHGLDPFEISEETSLLVIGRDGWDQPTLEALVKSRSGKPLRVYSQEMLLCYLSTGEDPLEAPPEVLAEFVAGHPGLEHLEGWGFPWPSTIVQLVGLGSGLDIDRPEKGWLRHVGYVAGARSPGTAPRRRALRRAFTQTLPSGFFEPGYVEEWGRPESATRLRKLADTLASLCRNAKRRSSRMAEAISHWEADLDWLKQAYYETRPRFPWPRVSDHA